MNATATPTDSVHGMPEVAGPAAQGEPRRLPGLSLIDGLLRDRQAVLDTLEDPAMTSSSARTLVITIIAGMAVLGATLGMYRGGVQVLYAAIKLPLGLLLTAGICTPAFSALQLALYGKTRIRRDLLVVLGTLALASMLGAAFAPILLLSVIIELQYHTIILLTVGFCGLAGLGGLSFFVGALKRWGGGRLRILAPALLVIFSTVGTQMAWTLRPFVVRPRTEEVPFVRGLEGGFAEAVFQSMRSAQGIYYREAAPLNREAWRRQEGRR